MDYSADLTHAQALDRQDPLAGLGDQFCHPTRANGDPAVYLCGNSLGLQPTGVRADVLQELDDWAKLGVDGHFDGRDPWFSYHEQFCAMLAPIVGARPREVVVMNSLTTNLHLMMVSFYRPTAARHKILMIGGAFPSDHYAVDSQVELHGYAPDDAVIEVEARPGRETVADDDVLSAIADHGNELALVMVGGVNYYTGQCFDMQAIAHAAHQVGARVGFDLAHAAGNVPLELHDWGVDFAVWCTYKYLNAGPGATGGCFVHDRHADAPDLPRLAGWWGTDPDSRFQMHDHFEAQSGAGGWQLSNAPVLAMAPLKASLELFDTAGMAALRQKSLALTDYLLDGLDRLPGAPVQVITPRQPSRRGSQISLKATADGRALFDALQQNGVVCDYRQPDVIRLAAAPMYNSFEDMWAFCDILADAL